MFSFTTILLLLGLLWLLAGVALFLHWLHPRTSLIPLMMYLGAIAAVMQVQGLRAIDFFFFNFRFNLDGAVLLPVLLFGILVVYIANGSVHGRSAAFGVLLISVSVFAFQSFLYYLPRIANMEFQFLVTFPLHIIFISVVTLGVSIFVLFLGYQSICNLRHRYPSRTASGVALLIALLVDAVIFSSLAFWNNQDQAALFQSQIIEKIVAGIALWPLLAVYIFQVAPRFPNTAATSSRPILDIFTTNLQLESRSRYHYNLLRTLSQINQLFVHSTDAELLLQQVCDALVELRQYHMVWIGSLDEQSGGVDFITQAGFSSEPIAEQINRSNLGDLHFIGSTDQTIVINDINKQQKYNPSWQQMMLKTGCRTAASFPMNYAAQVIGVLYICKDQPNSLEEIEIELLQELADNLAYTLINLEARKQQAILHAATETMQDGLLITDLHGKILYANAIIAQIVSTETNLMPGKNIEDYLVPDQSTLLPNTLKQLFENKKLIFDFPYQTHDARIIDISVNIAVVEDQHGSPIQLVANVRDISHLREYERQLLTLNRLTGELVQIHDTQVLMQRILEMGEELMGADASGIYFVDPETRKITDTLTNNLSVKYSQRIARDYRGLPGETAGKTLKPVFITDTLNDPIYGDRIHFMDEYKIRALLILPIVFHNYPIGALTVYYPKPHMFTESQLQLGLTLAQTLAIIIQNANLYKAEQEHRQLAEALIQAAASLNSSLDLEFVLDQILEQVMRVIPCKAANILMIKSDYAYVRRYRGYEPFPKYFERVESLKLPLSTPNIQQMLLDNKSMLIRDTTQNENWIVLQDAEWIMGHASVPLKVDGQIVGFLNIDSDLPNFFTTETLQYLEIFTDHASTAIKNARLYESSHQRAEEMAALVTAASAVSKNLDYMQVLQVVAEQMTRTLKIQACGIASYDLESDTVTYIVEHSPTDWKFPARWRSPQPLENFPATRKVLTNNFPFQLHSSGSDLTTSQHQFFAESGIKTFLLLPLITQDRTIGLVNLMDNEVTRVFTKREIALGLSLASHAATALENAHLYQQLQDHASNLEERVQKRTSELQDATDYIEGILASVPDAVFVLDQEHQLVRSNNAGGRLLSQAQTTGLDLFNPKLLQLLENGKGPDVQSILEVQGRAYQALSSQLITDAGHTSGQIIVFRDVTRFRELDQMKTSFVSDVSHELRTPLTNLTLYLGLLNTTRDQNKQDEYIQTLQRETDRLTHLIEDLLTISRLEANRIQFQIRATSINQLVEELVNDRAFLAAQKNIELNFTPAEDLQPAFVDENMLTQALSNLLTNATNYTQPGGSVTISTAQPEPDWITIQIMDTGVGIPTDEVEHIFNRFYRGSASHFTGAEGTGLGLSISREIIRRLGGKITIETSPGDGSTFTIWLKLALEDTTLPPA